MAKIPVVNMELQRLALSFTHPLFFPYAKFHISGTEHIPATGPAIIVGNHRSYFDAAALAMAIARTDRTVRFLGKKEVFDAPVVGQIASAMGGIRVDRGTGSDEPLQAAAEALANGDLVAIMPQGTIPRGRAFYDPELKGRWGAARLAALTQGAGHPGRPVGHREGVAALGAGAERAQRGHPADVTVTVGGAGQAHATAAPTPTRSGS